MSKDNEIDIESIKEDIRQGKEYDVISLKWDVSKEYIKSIASKMRKQGEILIDRRSEEWKINQLNYKGNNKK